MKRLIFAIALLALSGCTTTQVNDGAQWAAGQVVTTALDIAIGSGKGDEREYEPGRRTYCDLACEHRQEARIDAAYNDYERRKRRAESRAFQAEFDTFMRQLEEAGGYESASSLVLAESGFSP